MPLRDQSVVATKGHFRDQGVGTLASAAADIVLLLQVLMDTTRQSEIQCHSVTRALSPRRIISVIKRLVNLRQQEEADDDNQETHCLNVDRALWLSVANYIKNHTSAVADFTDQLNIDQIGRQLGQDKMITTRWS